MAATRMTYRLPRKRRLRVEGFNGVAFRALSGLRPGDSSPGHSHLDYYYFVEKYLS